jgi:hypothetical protein
MDRRYSSYSSTPATGRTATRGNGTGGFTDVETDYDRYQDHGDDYGDDYDDGYDEIYEYEDPIDRRWIWVAAVAGAILLIAVICTVVILGGGDSGSVSKTISATTATAPPVTASTAPPAMTSVAPPPLPSASLSPVTVTTVAPSPSPSPTASTDPAPAAAAPVPNQITYQVTGTRPLLDLVTIVYTDAQGALQTEFNVALPWSRTVTLDPGVELKSVTATSLTGQLNCAITDSSGAVIIAQTNNSMITTCTK